jgi:hypothetical protein
MFKNMTKFIVLCIAWYLFLFIYLHNKQQGNKKYMLKKSSIKV